MKYRLFSVLMMLELYSFAQGKVSKEGIIIFNKPFFRKFAILLQDTTLEDNRFDEDQEILTDSSRKYGRVQLPAFIVDSILFLKCEKKLLSSDKSVKFTHFTRIKRGYLLPFSWLLKTNERLGAFARRIFRRSIKRCIRIYIGYVSLSGNKEVLIQFITPKEFKRNKDFCSKQFCFWINPGSLRYAIITL